MEIPEGKTIVSVFKYGEKIKINTLITEVKGFKIENGQQFIITDYGDFNVCVVDKIEHDETM